MSTEIEQLFGGANAEEQNALLHVIKARGYDFLEKTPVTTMTVRLLEDLHKLGYKLVKNSDLLHSVSECDHEPIGNDDDLIEVCKHCGETYYDMP